MTLRVCSVFLLLITTLAAGCGSDSSTAPTPLLTSNSQFFVGTVGPGTTAVNTFSVSAQSFVHVTMASLISNANGEVADGGSVVLGFGTPSGANCATTASQVVTPNLSAQIRTGQLAA